MRYLAFCRRLVAASLATCVVFGAAASAAAPPGVKRPLVIAHRGGAASMPENTIPAFDNAVKLRVDMLEFDMEMTADDQLVVQHDGAVNPSFCVADRRSDLTPKPVRLLTLAQLRRFDCGSRHRDIYPRQIAVPGARMPTPAELFLRYRNAKVIFYGEAKMPGPGEGEVDPIRFARRIEAVIRKHGVEDRFILQSADYRTLDAMHELNPRVRTCLLRPWDAKTDFLELARRHHATCMLLRRENADAAQIRRLHEAGITIVSEVVDYESAWRDYIEGGWDAIFTNDPAALMAFLRRRNVAAPARR